MPGWYRIVSDRAVVRRAVLTSVGVGTVLTIVNQYDAIVAGEMTDDRLLPVAITYLVPFVVSLLSSWIAIRVERRDGALASDLLEREIDAINRFPGENPNPVLRLTEAGRLTYANESSAPIRAALGIEVGGQLPAETIEAFRTAAAVTPPGRIELTNERQTFAVLPVHVPELGVYNLYGTDVTAEKAVNKFPDENPNPVLRLTRDGRMTYANPASALVRKALGTEVGGTLAPEVLDRVVASLADGSAAGTIELEADGRTFAVRVVRVYEFDSINLYGTDITAARQVEAFSRENERLLLNILPPSIATRLRGGETVIADRFEDMAVLFADVVDFTQLSSRLAPTDVVSLLNEVFSTCDRLADRFGLEKIKTVGDAYMVVGGLHDDAEEHGPGRRGTHAADVADMGLAMLDELARLDHAVGAGLQVRVGMHVGPAVAGVIGLRSSSTTSGATR